MLVLEKSELGEGRGKQRGPCDQDPGAYFFDKVGVIRHLVRSRFNFNDDHIGETQLLCLPPLVIG